MTFKCYIPRTENRAALIGAIFIKHNQDTLFVPDHCLLKAELLSGSRKLRLTYSYCIVDVAGRCLKTIYEDACIGKIGTVSAAPPEESETAPDNLLCVTSIVVTPPPEAEYSVPEERWIDE